MLDLSAQNSQMRASWRTPASWLLRLRHCQSRTPQLWPSLAGPAAAGASEGRWKTPYVLFRQHARCIQAQAQVSAKADAAAAAAAATAQPAEHRARAAAAKAPAPAAADYLGSLSEEQTQAVKAKLGATRVVAGPGSGKTRVLTCRIAHLLHHHGVPAYQILAITFTNKAAAEMRERLEKLLGAEAALGLRAGTFHSFCHHLLRREVHKLKGAPWDRDFTLYDQDMADAVVRRLVMDENPELKGKDLSKEIAVLKSAITNAKNSMGSSFRRRGEDVMLHWKQKLAGSETLPAIVLQEAAQLGEMFDRYNAELAKNNAMDFDDLLGLTVSVLRECPEVLLRYRARYRHVLVDEFQDTNSAQYVLVKLLAAPEDPLPPRVEGGPPLSGKQPRSLFVVGDPDQAIYGWRGAEPRNMRSQFQKDFPDSKRLDLRDNYRSTACILSAAQKVISHNLDTERCHLRPKLPAREGPQLLTAEDDHDEARIIAEEIKRLLAEGEHPAEQVAVLYRTHIQSRLIEQEMVRLGIRYVLVGGVPFWRRIEVQDVLAYLRLAVSLRDDVALERVINVPKRALGPTSVVRLKEYAKEQGMLLSELLFGQQQGQQEEPSAATPLPPLPDRKVLGITTKAAEAVEAFRQAVLAMRGAVLSKPLPDALKWIMKEVDYKDYVANGGCSSNKDDSIQDRLARLEQLLVAAEEYEPGSITGMGAAAIDDEEDGDASSAATDAAHNLHVARTFLSEAALYSSVEEGGAAAPGVRLLTVHAAKGLEFEVVFLAGCVERRMPLVRGDELNLSEVMAEERRLFFVAITRAKQRLTLLHALECSMYGAYNRVPYKPSPFLAEALGKEAILDVAGQGRSGPGWSATQAAGPQQWSQYARRSPGSSSNGRSSSSGRGGSGSSSSSSSRGGSAGWSRSASTSTRQSKSAARNMQSKRSERR